MTEKDRLIELIVTAENEVFRAFSYEFVAEIIGNIHDNPDILKGGEENG